MIPKEARPYSKLFKNDILNDIELWVILRGELDHSALF